MIQVSNNAERFLSSIKLLISLQHTLGSKAKFSGYSIADCIQIAIKIFVFVYYELFLVNCQA